MRVSLKRQRESQDGIAWEECPILRELGSIRKDVQVMGILSDGGEEALAS